MLFKERPPKKVKISRSGECQIRTSFHSYMGCLRPPSHHPRAAPIAAITWRRTNN